MGWYDSEVKINEMIGRVFRSVEQRGGDELVFVADNGDTFTFFHSQDCCEDVSIESVVGDLSDLVGNPLLVAEEVTSETNPEDAKPETIEYQDSFTWTFYKFATIKGHVDVRWYGSSNGYYSESVDLAFNPAAVS